MMHLFKNRFKIVLKNKELIFWTLLFPIILGTFFNMAFSKLDEDEKFEIFNIGIINNDEYNISDFKEVLENSKEIFNITYIDDTSKADELLKKNKIEGYYYLDDEINIVVKKSNTNTTIMKYMVDSYKRTVSVINNIYEFDYTKFNADLVNKINSEYQYFKDVSSKNTSVIVIYFYTLIGMACLYGGMFGINAILDCEANLSKRGARFNVSPTNKFKCLIINLSVGFIIQYVEILILFAYLIGVLKINFGSQIPYLLLLTFFGSLAGISLGMMVGVSNRKKYDTKVGILNAITLFLSFLSGMMVWNLKYIIEKSIPIINRINPVSLITDALYSLYYYDNLILYTRSIISLGIFSLVMIVLSYLFLRRKKYDSI